MAAGANRSNGEQPQGRLDVLIRELGAAQFATRERATAELIACGAAALESLEAASDSPDREIRLRTAKIAASIRQADFDRRLSKFAIDDGEIGGDADAYAGGEPLPGWRRYRELIGDDADAKGLFVEMQRAAGALLEHAHAVAGAGQDDARPSEGEASEQRNSAGQRALERQLREIGVAMQDADRQFAKPLVAACLWAAADERIVLGEEECAVLFAICHQPSFRSDLALGDKTAGDVQAADGLAINEPNDAPTPPLRRLLGEVIRRCEGPSAYPALALAIHFHFAEGLSPAERLIRSGAGRAQQLQLAIFTIARFGNREHVSLMETLFANSARCASHRVDDIEYVAEVRDLALAAAWRVSGSDPRDHGFVHAQSQQQTVFAPASLGFASESERAAAFAAWAAQRK